MSMINWLLVVSLLVFVPSMALTYVVMRHEENETLAPRNEFVCLHILLGIIASASWITAVITGVWSFLSWASGELPILIAIAIVVVLIRLFFLFVHAGRVASGLHKRPTLQG